MAQVVGVGLAGVADDARNLGHFGEAQRVDLGRAAGDDDLGIGVFAREAADCLARLPRRLGGHRACIDDDEVVAARRS